jgi:predicted TPR repeat methyltransferase
MLEKARARGVYDHLECAELVAFLEAKHREADLIFAADVMVYFGDLARLFEQAAASLAPKGLFAFNIETTETQEFTVLPSGRFAHRISYVEGLAAKDFKVLRVEPATLRLEANRPVAGALCVLERVGSSV